MKVVEKTKGKHVEYSVDGNKIVFGDDDLSINLKNREHDEVVTIDICLDKDNELTMGVAAGMEYAAQVEIPARQYETVDSDEKDEDGNPVESLEPVPFNIDNCTLYLFAIE